MRPSIIKYAGPYTTPKQSRRDKGPSALHEQCENVTIPTLHGQDAAPLNPCYAAGPSVVLLQSKNAHPSSPSLATEPSVQSAMAGPSRAASPTQGQEVQHASPGPSGTQIQPEFANVSIFSYLSYRNI